MRKLQESIRKYATCSKLRLGVWLVILLLVVVCMVKDGHRVSKSAAETTEAGETTGDVISGIYSDSILYQSFYLKKPARLNSIQVRLGTHDGTVNISGFYVSIQTKRNVVLGKTYVSADQIVDNDYLTVSFDDIALNGLDRYYVVFRSDYAQENDVESPLVCLKKATSVEDILYQGGSTVKGLAVDAIYSYTTVPNTGHYVVAFLRIAIVVGLICMVRRQYIKSLLWQFVRAGWILFFGSLLWYNYRQEDPVNAGFFNQEQAWKFFGIILGVGSVLFAFLIVMWKWVKQHFQKEIQKLSQFRCS